MKANYLALYLSIMTGYSIDKALRKMGAAPKKNHKKVS